MLRARLGGTTTSTPSSRRACWRPGTTSSSSGWRGAGRATLTPLRGVARGGAVAHRQRGARCSGVQSEVHGAESFISVCAPLIEAFHVGIGLSWHQHVHTCDLGSGRHLRDSHLVNRARPCVLPRMVMMSIGLTGKLPFHTVYLHAMALREQQGSTVYPQSSLDSAKAPVRHENYSLPPCDGFHIVCMPRCWCVHGIMLLRTTWGPRSPRKLSE